MDAALARRVPTRVALAVVAAVRAKVVNNLPAILIVIPVVSPHRTGSLLAALPRVNLGPNLTDVGSLATLVWLRILGWRETGDVAAPEFPRGRVPNIRVAVRAFCGLRC